MALSRRTSRRPLPPQSNLSSDDESEGENELERNSRFSDGTASKLSDSISSASDRSAQLVLQNSHFRPSPEFTPKKAHRPRLDQFVAQFGGHSDVASSGYDSPRDLFDSGSWSSGADTRCSQSDESPPSTQIEVSSTEHEAIHNSAATTVPDYSIYSWVNKTVPVNDNSPLPSPPPLALISPTNSFNHPFSVQLKSHPFVGQSVARQKSLTSTQCCLRGIGTGPLMNQEPKTKTKTTANRPNSRLHCWLSRERSFDTTTTQSPESTNWWRDAMRSPISRTDFDRILMSTDRPSAPPHASPIRPTARKPLPPRHINASDSRISRTTSNSANGRSVSAYPRNIREPNASRSRSPSTQLSKLLQRLHPHQSSRLADCELATSWRRQF
ncbi:hypothetical protein M3Y98_01115400 [Aphelenchoides besseyi]|nr:hypothetical protein M3Y98_01115400 [Aphelenchoides besseyi]